MMYKTLESGKKFLFVQKDLIPELIRIKGSSPPGTRIKYLH